MPNTFRKKEINRPEESEDRSRKNMQYNATLNFFQNFISGDYLFSNNLWRSPLWFVMYLVVLILILVGARLIPVKKYNEIIGLREEVKILTVSSHRAKAKIVLLSSPEALYKDFETKRDDIKPSYSDVFNKPTVIKIAKNGKGK